MEAQVEPYTSSHNQKDDNSQSKINKQPEAPKNQTAWNSDNQGTKEKINQNDQTDKAADHVGQIRKPTAKQRTRRAGLAEGKTETQS